MGCISSKHAVSASPDFDISEAIEDDWSVISASSFKQRRGSRGASVKKAKKVRKERKEEKEEKEEKEKDKDKESEEEKEEEEPKDNEGLELQRSKKGSVNGKSTFSVRFGNLHKVEAEQIIAGWPSWLSAAAGEAIHGWLPLRADSFEKLEKVLYHLPLHFYQDKNCRETSHMLSFKALLSAINCEIEHFRAANLQIGQGTYSTVYRARDVETGRIVALKKVRFDNFQPESVMFMSREITILRRLDHRNIMKLEGIITSRLSCSIYLVFEYMEHDLAGLVSCPDIKFSVAQVKCYMQQLLSAIEHCHLLGVMHRDIKASNILVNNEGVLKLADFGLANILRPKHKQILTSRVVTLWYRPPELILGSTSYGVSVDLWSVGCVFAELLIGKPLFKGRTEVEQLHKIFKLCGSPPDEYWKKSKFPHATMFKPHHSYESTLRERFREYPTTALNLIETLLSVEPPKRGTASSALISEYFNTKPYACEPSSLPKYPPNKEIDAKCREEARRKTGGVGVRGSGALRKPRRSRTSSQEPNSTSKFAVTESNTQYSRRNSGSSSAHISKGKGRGFDYGDSEKPSFETSSQISQVSNVSRGDFLFQVPKQITAPCSFAWAAKRRKEHTAPPRTYSRCSSRYSAVETLDVVDENSALEFQDRVSGEGLSGLRSQGRDEMAKPMRKQRIQFDSFDTSDLYHSQEFAAAVHQGELARRHNLGLKDHPDRVEFSGPLLCEPHRVEEHLQRRESQIRQATQIPWLQKVTNLIKTK
ncbi:Protein impared in BABA-induced sterility 1 [Vitis vinifera]|uniref:Protein impared in BABA-induced sterility 1 n=1 Tax=Vitis vinifera TaxID=29760 RepID=A0A438D4Y3_VITVI|nr:Protein impared in BABA-induced sterility 1 [Vitis vinifera]